MESENLYRICPGCDFFCNSKEEDKFCSICGSELIESCPHCEGTISNPFAKYCKYCGKALPGRMQESKTKEWTL